MACHRLPCPPEIKLKHIKQCPSDYRLESQKLKPINSPYLVDGIPTPLTNHGVKVSWDDDIPNIWRIKHVPNHQPVVVNSG